MKIKLIDFIANKNDGEISLNEEIFAKEVRPSILHRIVNWQLAKRRAGTHKTKNVSEISGTTKKPFKQKGTGNARQGSLRSAQFRGGATIFGPVVRSHAHKLTKKFRILALKTALSSKLNDDNLIVVKNIDLESPKTSLLSKLLKEHNINSALFVGEDVVNDNFKKSCANIINVDVLPVQGINVYDILRHEKLVITESALKILNERLLNAK